MKTLSVTQARQNLSATLNEVRKGREVGILHNGEVFAIHRVQVTAEEAGADLPLLTEKAPKWEDILAPVKARMAEDKAKGRQSRTNHVLAERERRRR